MTYKNRQPQGAQNTSPFRPFRRGLFVILVTTIAFSSSACNFSRKPNLGRIYTSVDRPEVPHPVIMIPGFLGSKLRHRESGGVAWGRLLDAVRGGREDRFDLPIEAHPITANIDELVAFDMYSDAAGTRYYGGILRALKSHGGYRIGDIAQPRAGDNCFVFYYDWRRDLTEAAAALGAAIERVRSANGDPDLKVDLIAHSMGGLVARYFVLYGDSDVLEEEELPAPTYAGAASVDRVILIGTPNEGSLQSFKTLDQGMGKVSKPISARETFTMPAVYQMLPAPWIRSFIDADGRPLQVDLYDAANWERYGWSIFGEPKDRAATVAERTLLRQQRRRFLAAALRRAARFHEALRTGDATGSSAQYFSFGSDCTPTLEKAILTQRDNGTWEALFQDRAARYDARMVQLRDQLFLPGDGVVTRRSLLSFPEGGAEVGGDGTFHYAYFLCESHGMLTSDVMFQNNLFYVLSHAPTYRRAPTDLAGLAGS